MTRETLFLGSFDTRRMTRKANCFVRSIIRVRCTDGFVSTKTLSNIFYLKPSILPSYSHSIVAGGFEEMS